MNNELTLNEAILIEQQLVEARCKLCGEEQVTLASRIDWLRHNGYCINCRLTPGPVYFEEATK